MGSPDSDPDARDNEKPPHQVQVNGFAIGKYSVTQAQYEAVMGTNPSRFQNNPQNRRSEHFSTKSFANLSIHQTWNSKVQTKPR